MCIRDRILAGHLDTVPVIDNFPPKWLEPGDSLIREEIAHAHPEDRVLWGRGATDMKASDAVMLYLAATLDGRTPETTPKVDLTYVFYDHEEVVAEKNGLRKVVEAHPDWITGDFAIIGEPTNSGIEGGCNGTIRFDLSLIHIYRALGMPAPAISFEPGRYIVAPAGITLYRVGTIKHVHLSDAKDSDGNPIAERVYVSVDGGMSDNIRPALYGADYTARLANRTGSAETMLARVCGMHCESGDIVVHEVQLPADLKRGDILAVPVTGAYGRTMASNYNQALIPAVVAVSESGAHVMLRRQTVDDLLNLDVSE